MATTTLSSTYLIRKIDKVLNNYEALLNAKFHDLATKQMQTSSFFGLFKTTRTIEEAYNYAGLSLVNFDIRGNGDFRSFIKSYYIINERIYKLNKIKTLCSFQPGIAYDVVVDADEVKLMTFKLSQEQKEVIEAHVKSGCTLNFREMFGL